MSKTKIEWATHTWNPVTGCSPVSEGCQNCYAARMAKRLAGRSGYPKDDPFRVTFHPDRLAQPLKWKKPSRIFICSMGDLFHEEVPFNDIACILGIMAACQHHTFMVLTKRPANMLEFFKWLGRMAEGKSMIEVFPHDSHGWRCRHLLKAAALGATENGKIAVHSLEGWPLPNVWLGVTAENQARADERIPILLQIPAAKRFVSIEPMLGPVDIARWLLISWQCSGCRGYFNGPYRNICPDCGREGWWSGSHPFNGRNMPRGPICRSQKGQGLDWVICGGETGPGARPLHPDWARSLRDQCQDAGVPFFFKQWGEWKAEHRQSESVELFRLKDNQQVAKARDGGHWLFTRVGKKRAGRLLNRQAWDEFPERSRA